MFSARFTRHQGIPAATLVVSAVALTTLTAGCGASASSSSAAAVSATASEQASTAARAASTASAGVSKAAGLSTPADSRKTAGAIESSGVTRPAGVSKSAGDAGDADAPAGTAKLTGADATALLSKAVANTQAASSVQVTGQAVPTGSGDQTESFNLTLVRNAGCEGAVTLSPTKAFKVVETGGYVWMLPSNAYYASTHMSKKSMAQVEGKYIKMKATDSQVGDLATVCTFPGLLGQLDKPAGAAFVAVPATGSAGPGYRVTEAGQHGAAFIAKAPALLLQISDLQPDNGSIAFGQYDATSAITIPSAAETIDGTSN